MGSRIFYSFMIWSCFTILCFSAHSHSHSHGGHEHDHHHHNEAPSFKYSKQANEKPPVQYNEQPSNKEDKVYNSDLWFYAMGSTLLISAAPVIILFFVPIDNTEEKQPLLKILLAFASGGLLGDAFLHLIPHATMSVDPGHSHSHSHDHEGEEGHVHDMSIGLGVLSGILAFLVVEKGVRFIKGGHGHSHSKKDVKQINDTVKANQGNKDKTANKSNSNKLQKKEENTNSAVHYSDIKVAGYLNLAADFSHNFTDGLAIGASYLAGTNVGLITTITILLHEVPHEIGDFAILLQSGVSRKNAMLLQLSTAFGALAGTALSLYAQDGSGLLAANWVLPFTAGGFIYIALVSVIPELLEEEKPSLIQTILQLTAMVGGIYMMVRIAEFE